MTENKITPFKQAGQAPTVYIVTLSVAQSYLVTVLISNSLSDCIDFIV